MRPVRPSHQSANLKFQSAILLMWKFSVLQISVKFCAAAKFSSVTKFLVSDRPAACYLNLLHLKESTKYLKHCETPLTDGGEGG